VKSGWVFWSRIATVGSPARNAAVNSSVASADPPHPITSKAS